MPKKTTKTAWGKTSLKDTIVQTNDFTELKNAINNHRSFITSQSYTFHNNLLNGNYGFTVTQTQGANISYNSINDIKKGINDFYYGDGFANKPYSDVTTNYYTKISTSDVQDLRDKINHIEINCVACDTCQFSTWTSDYSNWSNWSEYSDWSNWSDYSNYSNWAEYSNYSNWNNYGNWSDYSNYSNWSDYSNYSNWSDYSDYSQACPNCPLCPDASWSGQSWKSNTYLT